MTVTIPARSKSEPRVEDDALVRGAGRFMDDPRLPGQTYAAFVRSPHAHARVLTVNTDAALKAKGVLAVLTAADIKTAGVGSLTRHNPLVGRGGVKLVTPFRPALAGDKVMHGGDPVALVVAETHALALDAADLVDVAYEELTPVVDLNQAMKAATVLYDDAPGNVAIDWPGMTEDKANEAEVDRLIAAAAHVAKVTVTNQRMVVASMETRGATGVYDKSADHYTLYASSQGADTLRGMAASIMGVPNDKLRVITQDVGGAFGMKTPVYPEYIAVLVAAKKLGRPVHWMSTRSEAFVTDTQARDTVTHVELACDGNGRFTALRVRHLCNQGAYVSNAGVQINTVNFWRCLPAMYDIPKMDVSVACYFTNTLPIGPYRGAGRPEANYALERAVEEAARLLKMDPARLRRKNLIPAKAMPFKTPIQTYDSGDFPAIVEKALKLADYDGFVRRKREAQKRKKLRGIGISCMLEHAGSMPTETASVSFPGGDKVIVGCNVQSTGQSHATVFSRLLATRLGIDAKAVEHRHGDTDLGLTGFASVGSRSAMCAGSAILVTADLMLEKASKIAAAALEAADSDIQYRDGRFEVVGTDRRISLFETAQRAQAMGESLDTKGKAEAPLTFPNGCHIAEVEIDPDTGHFDIVTYTAVDDCGNVLDQAVVEGQVQGSIANGLGQALTENAVYDSASGQLVTGSFMDYGMPRAHDMPLELREATHAVPATTNPLGVKGTGEAGTTAAIAAVMNAISNAVPNGAADHMDMPATPAKVWAAVQKGMGK
ncbi:xanthine dehydrogenase family protein molybdopterin-binding subunit [Pseudolabrys sp. Root1462]|uniref:xanthine dehydrogenase family protein molybdopterin-binding subunit n=1 Tax=Pseudolabrys sp. Root1462 TaxID=1736466 RepID=UPI000A46E126|nr:xanthine dehydrogenase family protein molybdopterin-binding subunit [Pseudolabrys sp. Root1462]